MKHLITIWSLFILTAASAAPLTAKTAKDSLTCLTISGNIEDIASLWEDNETYTVELIYYNTVKDVITRKDNKSFSFKLKRNAIYTIRISKEGYIPKLISINTSLDTENKESYYFHFATGLLKEDMKQTLDEESLEFPIAIVEFNDSKKVFYYNEKYTENIKKNIYLTSNN